MTDTTAAEPIALSITGITHRKITDQIVTATQLDAAGQHCGDPGKAAARFRSMDNRPLRHTLGPGGVGGGEDGHGAAADGIGDEGPAIDPRARQSGKQVPRQDMAAVRRHTDDVEFSPQDATRTPLETTNARPE